MMVDNVWIDATKKQPQTKTPIIFETHSERIEGWYIFNNDKKIYQYVKEKINGGWIYYKTKDVVRWRKYGNIELLD